MITPGSLVITLHYKKAIYPIRFRCSKIQKAFGNLLRVHKKNQGL